MTRAEDGGAMEELSRRVRLALEAADPAAFGELLDPDVRWGPPGARRPPCRNRRQVLAWYERGREAGVRAAVGSVSVHGDRLVVELAVRGREGDSSRRDEPTERWQVLTARGGRITDIVGFDSRSEAEAWAQSAAT